MMSTSLLTFLGRLPEGQTGYRKTTYDFGDGELSEPVAFFGFPLQKRIGADRLVVMGTAGSMWHHLFEGDIAFGREVEEARIRLLEAADKKAVSRDLLEPLQDPLAERLGCEVRLAIIPYCRDEREQIDLIRIMARYVEPGDAVHIDVSHGLRHLPMIALLAALHLQVARQAEVGGIWYGAYDPDTGEAPVHNLVGLLRIFDWIKALSTYDKDGDYGVFSPLLGSAGELLERAAFFERTSNPVKAREALTAWATRTDRFPQDDPAAELFREELERRVGWHRRPDRASWEKELAVRHLQQGDYVRAAIFGLEAVISARQIASKGKVDNRREREAAKDDLLKSNKDFSELNHLRNALVHGTREPTHRIGQILKDESSLRGALQRLLTQLFNVDPKSRG